MDGVKQMLKQMLSKFKIILIMICIITVLLAIASILLKKISMNASAASSNGYNNYTNLGDYIVKTDEDGAMPELNKEQLKTAVDKMYSGQTHDNYIDWLDYFIEMQDKYKVNAAFGICVAQWEHQGGTDWGVIPPESYNLFSIKNEDNTGWMYYSGYKEAIIEGFGKLIAESSNYFAGGNYTVKKIRDHYDNDPNEQWAEKIEKELDSFYAAAGVALSSGEGTYSDGKYEYAGHTYTLFSQHDYSYNYGGNPISQSGCGVTSIAICVSGYKSGETPESIAKHCVEDKRIWLYMGR